ncbi:short-chain dehydrogenase/reductase [Marasmius fiardii PR-910]|nr:short-chain dehydrogenase/reductase [Marasmius fiardii PR-910]
MTSLTSTYHRDTYPAISPTNLSLSQSGKAVLITGGGGGLGFEIARSFAKASASRVIIVSRRPVFLEEAVEKLRKESGDNNVEFIARDVDLSDESSVNSLWDILDSQKILVHVLVLNAAYRYKRLGTDVLNLDVHELQESFGINVAGNFRMVQRFIKQPLRFTARGQLQLNLVNVSSASIQIYGANAPVEYTVTKSAFTQVIGRLAEELPATDVQIVSFHPGLLYAEEAAKRWERSSRNWDEMALPGDFSVWAASAEASWLHGRYVWAYWDVEELKVNISERLEEERGFLKVGVQGLPTMYLQAKTQ